jgi:DNA-binding NarL/FixJ family response regulator
VSADRPIRLVLADDHPVVLAGLADALRAAPNVTVLASCEEGYSALRAVQRHKPDVAVLDIRMPGLSGLQVLREIRRNDLPTRVLLLTADIDEDQTLEALRQGVHGVILKSMAGRLLIEGIKKVAAGGHWVERESLRLAVQKLLRRENARAEGLLTPSESRIVEFIADGMSNGQIAEALHVSDGTVKSHVHNIYTKLEVSNRRELLDRVREKGLV